LRRSRGAAPAPRGEPGAAAGFAGRPRRRRPFAAAAGARPRRRGTRGTRRARQRRAEAAASAPRRPRRARPRSRARRAAAGCGTARRGRARARPRPPGSARRAGRRRSRPVLRCGRWRRPARGRGSRPRSGSAAAACARRRRPPRRPGLPAARRSAARVASLGDRPEAVPPSGAAAGASGRGQGFPYDYAVARVRGFRAVRYDERVAGPLESLVAPPYDVIDEEARARLAAQSPYNVVHLTLPSDEAEAARLWREWRARGALTEDGEPALWWLAQDYTGPDGVARRRDGLVCALRVEPYSARVVLPHERTHAGPKEGRLRLLRALRAHVEPIFLLYDGALEPPRGEPLVDVELDGVRSRLWRSDDPPPSALADASLLIADGHHRYETAL